MSPSPETLSQNAKSTTSSRTPDPDTKNATHRSQHNSSGRVSMQSLKPSTPIQPTQQNVNVAGEQATRPDRSAKAKSASLGPAAVPPQLEMEPQRNHVGLQRPTPLDGTASAPPETGQYSRQERPATLPTPADESPAGVEPGGRWSSWAARIWKQDLQAADASAPVSANTSSVDTSNQDSVGDSGALTEISPDQDMVARRSWLSWGQNQRNVGIQTKASVQRPEPYGGPDEIPVPLSHADPGTLGGSSNNLTGGGWALWPRSRGAASPGPTISTDEPNQAAMVRRASDPEITSKSAPSGETSELVSKPNSYGLSTAAPGTKRKESDAAVESQDAQKKVRVQDNTKNASNNLLVPTLEDTLRSMPRSPTFLQRLNQWLFNRSTVQRGPDRLAQSPNVQNAVAIGVHGLFPAPMLQTILGRPTGTSIKFVQMAAEAIDRFATEQGSSIQRIDKIALEGSGRIDERLELLWRSLLNWIDLIREADVIFMACHSQGVPVGISLMAKLIHFGCCKKSARIGICAMAGVNLGPFAEYRSRWLGGTAGELFEFARRDSQISRSYRASLETVLNFGTKLTFIGSLDDQLVSLHSSTFSSIHHPLIYRAVWIDGRLHVANFLTCLIGFALKARNIGIPDHGLIKELSRPLAGSLVGGEGHSRIYEDHHVYDLALDFTLRTSSVHGLGLETDQFDEENAPNPYVLPFALRGLLEEDPVRNDLSMEVSQLLRQFDEWTPATKGLRDVKYRLAGLRAKVHELQ